MDYFLVCYRWMLMIIETSESIKYVIIDIQHCFPSDSYDKCDAQGQINTTMIRTSLFFDSSSGADSFIFVFFYYTNFLSVKLPVVDLSLSLTLCFSIYLLFFLFFFHWTSLTRSFNCLYVQVAHDTNHHCCMHSSALDNISASLPMNGSV